MKPWCPWCISNHCADADNMVMDALGYKCTGCDTTLSETNWKKVMEWYNICLNYETL
jgi:hypothetical protein